MRLSARQRDTEEVGCPPDHDECRAVLSRLVRTTALSPSAHYVDSTFPTPRYGLPLGPRNANLFGRPAWVEAPGSRHRNCARNIANFTVAHAAPSRRASWTRDTQLRWGRGGDRGSGAGLAVTHRLSWSCARSTTIPAPLPPSPGSRPWGLFRLPMLWFMGRANDDPAASVLFYYDVVASRQNAPWSTRDCIVVRHTGSAGALGRPSAPHLPLPGLSIPDAGGCCRAHDEDACDLCSRLRPRNHPVARCCEQGV